MRICLCSFCYLVFGSISRLRCQTQNWNIFDTFSLMSHFWVILVIFLTKYVLTQMINFVWEMISHQIIIMYLLNVFNEDDFLKKKKREPIRIVIPCVCLRVCMILQFAT